MVAWKGSECLKKGSEMVNLVCRVLSYPPSERENLGNEVGNGRENVGCYDNKTNLPVYRMITRTSLGYESFDVILVNSCKVAYMWEYNFCPLMRTFYESTHARFDRTISTCSLVDK